MTESNDELDQRLRDGLHDVPVRRLHPNFDSRVIGAVRKQLPWYLRYRNPMTLALACAVAALVLVALVAHVLPSTVPMAKSPIASPAGDNTATGAPSLFAPPKPHQGDAHYGGVLTAP
ncbi:MAG TPA: hypothetical protein VGK19_24270 [Capsulimonadaceae bacterium]|jgi:hypothetical protein